MYPCPFILFSTLPHTTMHTLSPSEHRGLPVGAGSLEVICGSMFSGKTEELIRRLKRARIARQTVQVFKPRLDDRYAPEQVASHSGFLHEAIPVDGVDRSGGRSHRHRRGAVLRERGD